MRPFIGPQQHHQQPQQYGAHDNCLKQQNQHQHFLKSQHQQQQQQHQHPQQQQFQQNYHQQQQHSLQQQQQQLHNHNNALQQTTSTVPPPHLWNHAHLNPNCYGLAANHSYTATTTTKTSGNTIPLNLQNCRPFPTTRAYQQHHHTTHNAVPHYTTSTNASTNNGYPAHPNSERIALTTASPNYAKLPPLSVVNQQRINECAGIPLISTATAHLTPGQRQRISRKQSHSPPGKNWPNMLSTNTAASTYAQYAAAHVQGAPLMLQKPLQQQQHITPQAFVTKPMGQYNNKQLDRTRTPLRYQNSAPAALASTKSKENLDIQLKQLQQQQQQHSSKDSENSSSTNGDGNSNETCLPRIIKPRKRRKKDRKPVNNLVTSVYLKMDTNPLKKSSEDIIKGLQKLSYAKGGCQELMQHSSKTTKTAGVNMSASFYGKPPELNSMNVSQCMSSLTRDAAGNHGGICFCNECDPLRSLWDYPLRRSLSDSSATSESSGTGSLSDNTTASNECNWPKSRAEIVGVIGSRRNKDTKNNSNHTSNTTNTTNENILFNHNILSGINLSGELFKSNNESNFITSPPVENMLLLPETAETLLTRSINEISKKLIETCSSNETSDFPLSSCNSLSSFSTTSSTSSSSSSSSSTSSANSICADFSNDSGIESAHINVGDDLVFNFDNLHITTTAKATLSQSSSSSSSSASESSTLSSASLSSSCSSASTSSSSCGNISMSSSPTVKFATNFLTTPTTATSSMGVTAGTAATNSSSCAVLTPSTAMGLTIQPAAPTLDFLLDLNNNHLHSASTLTTTPTSASTTTTTQIMLNHIENNQNKKQQKQQFNDLLPQNHQPPHQQRQQLTTTLQKQQQPEKQFFNNCFDLMWQQHEHERQLANNTNNNSSSSSNNTITTTNPYHHHHHHPPQHTDQLSSSAGLISNNVAVSSFLDSVGSLKTVFSTIY